MTNIPDTADTTHVPVVSAPSNPPIPSIVYGTPAEGLGPNGNTVPTPDASAVINCGNDPSGASPRPDSHDAAMGQGPAAGDAGFREACQTPPSQYVAVTDRSNFRG